jgi:hypothetical protein
MAAPLVGLPVSCGALKYKARAAVSHRTGHGRLVSRLAGDVQEFDIKSASFKAGQNLHAWWWPAARRDAPAILYLHGVRWNLTGQAFASSNCAPWGIRWAIDYRGFGQSHGDLPSEASVYEDARAAWERFGMQPGCRQASDLRSLTGRCGGHRPRRRAAAQAKDHVAVPVRGLVIESTFTSLGDAVAEVADNLRSLAAGALAAVAEVRLHRQDRRHRHAVVGGPWHGRAVHAVAIQPAVVQRPTNPSACC